MLEWRFVLLKVKKIYLKFTGRTPKGTHEKQTFCCWKMTVNSFFYMCNGLCMCDLLSCTGSACICSCSRRMLDHNLAQERISTDTAAIWQYQENDILGFLTLCTAFPSPFGFQNVPILWALSLAPAIIDSFLFLLTPQLLLADCHC